MFTVFLAFVLGKLRPIFNKIQKTPQGSPRDRKGIPQVPQDDQRTPKDGQREPKGTPKGVKGSPKSAQPRAHTLGNESYGLDLAFKGIKSC